MEWQFFNNIIPVHESGAFPFFCDPRSVLLDYVALSLKIWKLGGRPGLVAYGNTSKGLGVSQLLKSYDVVKGPSSVAIGTRRL